MVNNFIEINECPISKVKAKQLECLKVTSLILVCT